LGTDVANSGTLGPPHKPQGRQLCDYRDKMIAMHRDHAAFIAAIHSTQKVRLRFFSKEDGGELIRTCAPFDFGPSKRTQNQSDRYHFWDYDSDQKNHVLSLLPDQVVSIAILDEAFTPGDIITWTPMTWTTPRNWGSFS
jgi:hypothetical protein